MKISHLSIFESYFTLLFFHTETTYFVFLIEGFEKIQNTSQSTAKLPVKNAPTSSNP